MKVTWYGTASILLETNDCSLLFDPYLKDLPKGREQKEITENRKHVFASQKNVLITHGHFDHLSSIKQIYNDVDCNIYLTKTPYNTLKARKFDEVKLHEIKLGDELNFNGVNVRVLHGKHIKFIRKDIVKSFLNAKNWKYTFRALRLGRLFFKYPEKEETVFYEIEAEGKLIQIMGSADLNASVEYKKGADLLILPHQGRSDIDEHNKVIVQKLMPKRVLLDHYDDAFPPYTSQVPVEEFCIEMSSLSPTDKFIEGVAVEI